MKEIIATIRGVSAYCQSRFHNEKKLEKESAADHEERTWMKRLHVNHEGFVIIPPFAIKNCISEAARYLAIQIKGKGKTTFTKHFEAGVAVFEPLVLNVRPEDIKPTPLFVPSNGKRGGSKRVMKYFPFIHDWGGDVTFYVFDDTITDDIFKYHLEQAGKFIGLGSFRPRNNGINGRFLVEDLLIESKPDISVFS